MELQGKVVYVSEPRTGLAKTTGNPWMTQDYVIETHESFPHKMMFNVFGEDKIKQFNIQLGEEINVFFDINAREYNGKYYNDIRAWRVDRVQPGQPVAGQPAATAAPRIRPLNLLNPYLLSKLSSIRRMRTRISRSDDCVMFSAFAWLPLPYGFECEYRSADGDIERV